MVKLIRFQKIKTAVFISETESHLKNLIRFSTLKRSHISINPIISNNNQAKGLKFAKTNRIKKKIFNFKNNLNEKKILSLLKKELLKPTKIYVHEVLKLIEKNLINGCANITGGGLADNIKRIIPENLNAQINLNQIKTTNIFHCLKKNGISEKELLNTVNRRVRFRLIIRRKK